MGFFFVFLVALEMISRKIAVSFHIVMSKCCVSLRWSKVDMASHLIEHKIDRLDE